MFLDSLFDTLACGARAPVYEAWQCAEPSLGLVPDEIDTYTP